jgi:uncharacterized membrane protein
VFALAARLRLASTNRAAERSALAVRFARQRERGLAMLFSTLDLFALAWFLCAWVGYSTALSSTERNKHGLNSEMNRHRLNWMGQMAARETRMVDTQIVAALQNGTAFFASTSLIAVGGALTLVRGTGEALQVVAALPLGVKSTPMQWEAKSIGLAVILVYAFFKFAWSYRLYNYVAILVGATPPASEKGTSEAKAHVERVGALCEVAGRHFNRGQRAFFFALGYLGWFISPWLLMITSIAVAAVLWRRQFASDSRSALISE